MDKHPFFRSKLGRATLVSIVAMAAFVALSPQMQVGVVETVGAAPLATLELA